MSTTLLKSNPYDSDPNLSEAVKEFLKPLNAEGNRPLESLSVTDARNVLTGAQQAFKVDLSGIEEYEKIVEHAGFTITLNIVRPEGEKGTTPVFMYIHGGGWVLGDYPTHKRMVRDLVVLTGFTGVFVEYKRAPEVKYPYPVNEVYAAAQWIAANGSEINVDAAKLAIVGNSAGGNLAAATILMAKENGGPDFKAQILFWPVTDANFERESWKLFGTERFLTASLMQWMWDQYVEPSKRNEIFASPLQATVDQLKGLPPTLIQVAENDILRDEGEAFGRKLLEAGVDATTVRFNDVIHDWGLLNGLADLPQTKALFEQAAATLKKYLK
ncbi:alpha/beta hydrolase fold domain-containing protein [Flavobacterium sp. Sd200]|uniref:alpha/beta hydrolase n=1 Tax=Flavobacterium sp. Sd200 TaxID=2692211 RepID=UPI00136DB22B|nr:alpha/beta hydrolase [Flavobacterium sp. Sd200]MXN90078.1 alpha/beta hydrolase fold domain-containing protein [Flavobacterium sp. Sd200]